MSNPLNLLRMYTNYSGVPCSPGSIFRYSGFTGSPNIDLCYAYLPTGFTGQGLMLKWYKRLGDWLEIGLHTWEGLFGDRVGQR